MHIPQKPSQFLHDEGTVVQKSVSVTMTAGLTAASGSSAGNTGRLPGLSGSQYSCISLSNLSAHACNTNMLFSFLLLLFTKSESMS